MISTTFQLFKAAQTSVKTAEKMYLQRRSTVPSMSPKTDGRLSTMTTLDEAGNIRAFPLGPRLQRSGARK